MNDEPWFLLCLPRGVTKLVIGDGDVDAFSALCQALEQLPERPLGVETTRRAYDEIGKHQGPNCEFLSYTCLRVWTPRGALIVKCA